MSNKNDFEDTGTYWIKDPYGIETLSTHAYRILLKKLIKEEIKRINKFREAIRDKKFKKRFQFK